MTTQDISLDYVNNLVFELEKAFWDERGKGARFRVTTVGRQYFRDKVLPVLHTGDVDHVVKTVQYALQCDGLLTQIDCVEDGRLLRIKVLGCAHRPVEERMVASGVPPFTCLPANLIALALEEKLDRPVELAEIKLEPTDGGETGCGMLLVRFDKRPELVPTKA